MLGRPFKLPGMAWGIRWMAQEVCNELELVEARWKPVGKRTSR